MELFLPPGGDSKTLMIVQVAPVEKNVCETLTSLNFAKRVRTVELGAASKKTDATEVCVTGLACVAITVNVNLILA